jgi:hypothetical protein
VRTQQLIDETANPDLRQYLKILYGSSANLLSFTGFTSKSIFEAVTQEKQKQNNIPHCKFGQPCEYSEIEYPSNKC